MFGVNFLNVFETSLLTKAAFIWSKMQKICNILKYYHNLKWLVSILYIFYNVIHCCDDKTVSILRYHMILQKSF